MMRALLILSAAWLLSGCVANVPLTRQMPEPQYLAREPILVSVVDERERVKAGKKPTFIGVAHGTFGIPFDWHVDPAIAVEPGDAERDLAQFLEFRLLSGLAARGWNASSAGFTAPPSAADIDSAIAAAEQATLLLLRVREWYFSINLNWVTAFNFDTDTQVEIYRKGESARFEKVLAGRDVIDVSANQSPRNHILMAYRDQLNEIVNDPEIQQALAE